MQKHIKKMSVIGQIKHLVDEHQVFIAIIMLITFVVAVFFYQDSKTFQVSIICFAALSGVFRWLRQL